jgi:hypothetical protein
MGKPISDKLKTNLRKLVFFFPSFCGKPDEQNRISYVLVEIQDKFL